jgi:hypothetical protein
MIEMASKTEVSTMIDIASIKTGVEVLEKLGVLERLALKLVNNPHKAARQLNLALSELSRGYTVFYHELLALGNISFEDKDLNNTCEQLTKIKDGHIEAELGSVKGSCSKIWNIYETYLEGWFSSFLSPLEQGELTGVFMELADVDDRFLGAVKGLSNSAKIIATNLLTLVKKQRITEARAIVENIETDLAPMREALSLRMKQLWDLQERFIKVGRVV